MPEIVEKCYIHARCGAQATSPSPISSGDEDEEGSWYYCWQDLEGSTLIGCDNASCMIKWYHVSCLKLKEEPEGDLICLLVKEKDNQAIIIQMSSLFNCTTITKILLWGAPFIAKLQTELSNNELWWEICNSGLLH